MPVRIKQKNPGALQKLLERYKGGADIAVGFPKGSDSSGLRYPDGTELLDVAYFNELGVGVPERSFLRAGVRANIKDINKLSAGLVKKINSGDIDLEEAAEVIGLDASAKVKQFIVDLSDPPNAPQTVKAKGSSNPLVDNGLLSQSVTHEVRERK